MVAAIKDLEKPSKADVLIEFLDASFWMKQASHLELIGWSHPPGSNRRPADYEFPSLPQVRQTD
jgi:hypothetical protein